jgi:hypothetical protein
MDFPLVGGSFTWSLTLDPFVWPRIDHFLVSSDWEARFPVVSQKRLPHLYSDHFLILLDCGDISRGSRPFKFENMWLKADGFVGMVKQWWDSFSFQGTPSYVLAFKLKALKQDLKKWNEEVFGNVERNKRKLFEELQAFDAIEGCRTLVEEELLKKTEIVSEIERCSLLEEVSWRQKLRVMWLKEGDKCTKFFHSIANSNRRYKSMDSLLIGDTPSNQTEIGEHVVMFYQKLFSKPCRWRPMVDGISFDSILVFEASWLERAFQEEEVRKVVSAINGEKAPGPDGFSMAFFQACWDVLSLDIMKVFYNFHARCLFEKSLNVSFISLIPKIPGANSLKDFRPISLVGGICKIIAKVLANRLKSVLEKVISKSQSAFIKGRQILDSILIANEYLDSRLRSWEPGVICKMDFGESIRLCKFGFSFVYAEVWLWGKMVFVDSSLYFFCAIFSVSQLLS